MKMIRYRIIQSKENCFYIQRKIGWFWWDILEGNYAGDWTVTFPSIEKAVERVALERKWDKEHEDQANFKKRVFEVSDGR